MATMTLTDPTISGSNNTWGATLNANHTLIENAFNGASQIEPALSEGGWEIGATTILATGAEINLLDGVTYTLTDLNGLTASITELNYSAGVTSAIQTQINTLRGTSSGASDPAAPVANMLHYQTSDNLLKIRNEANDAFITIGHVRQSENEWQPHIGGKRVKSVEATMTAGTTPDDSLVTQTGIKSYVDALITKTGTAPVFGVRAFCVWDGTGLPGATTPQASGNIGTLTKDAIGQWTVTFTTALPDANYAVTYTAGTTSASDGAQNTVNVFSTSTGGFSFTISDATGNDYRDANYNSFTVVR